MRLNVLVLAFVFLSGLVGHAQIIVHDSAVTRHERARETHIAQVDFVLREHVPNAFVRVNPLGLQIAYFRVDQAFEERGR